MAPQMPHTETPHVQKRPPFDPLHKAKAINANVCTIKKYITFIFAKKECRHPCLCILRQ